MTSRIIFNENSISVSTDLSSQWTSAIKSLETLDFSGIGGSPLEQYYSNVSTVQITHADLQNAYGSNAVYSGFSLFSGAARAAVLPGTGTDLIKIDTKNIFGLNITLAS